MMRSKSQFTRVRHSTSFHSNSATSSVSNLAGSSAPIRRDATKPFFLYLSHKAVHSEFIPAQRHKGRYEKAEFVPPPTMAAAGEMARNRPMWVRNQRNSWHGVDFPYHSNL